MPTKFFRVATEGATTDGREIQRSWIEQAAKNYNRATYGARVWLEHLRGITPDSAFSALGDVLALEARSVEDGKLALFAQIEALPALVAMNKAKQKIFTSVEIDPEFAKTGEAYMVGLAVTDTPASLGTEVLKFAAANPEASPFASKKSSKGALFSAAVATDLGMDEDAESIATKLLAKFSEMLGGLRTTAPTASSPASQDFAAQALGVLSAADAAMQSQARELATANAAHTKLAGEFNALQTEFKALTEKLSKQDGNDKGRPVATGNEGAVLTDC